MYIIIITWTCSDPEIYGPFKTIKSAEIALKQLKREWTERDFYKGETYIKKMKK